MIIKTHRFNLLVQYHPRITIAFRLDLPNPVVPNLAMAIHLAWVLTPYLGKVKTHRLLTRFGYFLLPGEDGYWRDVLPEIELL